MITELYAIMHRIIEKTALLIAPFVKENGSLLKREGLSCREKVFILKKWLFIRQKERFFACERPSSCEARLPFR
ncbi:MAG: hypothetical protein D3908_09170 [Candidatus Electrothrix sp. AUS4]|nr:hypothetical protein [Candidatus Electrothrix sp. AUS4]